MDEDNDEYDVRLFQSIDHVVEMYYRVVLVGFVRFFHRLFHLNSDQLYQIHHVHIHHVVIDVVMVFDDYVQSMDNIIHNNLHMFDDHTEDNDDEQHVEQLVLLKIKEKTNFLSTDHYVE